MSKSLLSIIQKVENVIKNAPCNKYSYIDRVGILKYHKHSKNKPLPFIISSALQIHCFACLKPYTKLQKPIFVFCGDNLNNTKLKENLDLQTSLRLKLGYYIDSYEKLVRWYLSVSL